MANNQIRVDRLRSVCRGRVYVRAIGLFLVLLEVGCGGDSSSSPPVGLHRDAACAPDEVVHQLRESLSNVRTTDPAPAGKGFAIATDSIREQNGKQERMVKYRIVVEPAINGNGSTIRLERIEDKAKGIRERTWHDAEAATGDPKSEQEVWARVQSVCRPTP